MEYRPLPNCLTIKNSKINGLGLFTTNKILKNTLLGVTHYITKTETIRTPLGGFYNHSNEPNCIKNLVENKYYLYTLRDIEQNEEITVKYTFDSYKNIIWKK